MALIAEDLLLLLLDDVKGTAGLNGTYLQPALGGAVLIELALLGTVTITDPPGLWKGKRVDVTPTALADRPVDPVLAQALTVIAAKHRAPATLVTTLGKGLAPTLSARLESVGILRQEHGRTLGLFPRTRWPAANPHPEQQVREQIRAALVQDVTPSERTAALIAVLSAIDCAHKVIDRGDRSARDVRRRAKQIADGEWAATAVRAAVQASQAAMFGAVSAAATVAASGA